MLRADTAAIAWMTQYQRDPYPTRIVWRQDNDVLRNDFYWLHVSNLEIGAGKTIIVHNEGNRIYIDHSDCREITFLLNDVTMNLDHPIHIFYKGQLIHSQRVRRQLSTMRETLYERNDPAYAAPAKLTVRLP